jgi:hypothetical protein
MHNKYNERFRSKKGAFEGVNQGIIKVIKKDEHEILSI